METRHRILIGDARSLDAVADDSIELVVTSPPYPMIELWDDLFHALDPAIGNAIEAGHGREAFERMHAILDDVWTELGRVLVDGGIACVNVGDAIRTLDGHFRQYPNRARIVHAFDERGFVPLPDALWRKPANSATKFMGSGMLPPNAYVTLEHEYVLPFRYGQAPRQFEAGDSRRYEAAYFWEERNDWFSDLWMDVRGVGQKIEHDEARNRSAAYPIEIPYRLICMFSVYGDTILDPFWGTGTTSLAAMVAGRNSVGVEIDDSFREVFENRLADVREFSAQIGEARLRRHLEFVAGERERGGTFDYEAANYRFSVKTAQERRIRLYEVAEVAREEGEYRVIHEPFDLLEAN